MLLHSCDNLAIQEVPRNVIRISFAASVSPRGKTGNASKREFFCDGSDSFNSLELARPLSGLASISPPIEAPESFSISLRVSFIVF
jgi:hypothetical protein